MTDQEKRDSALKLVRSVANGLLTQDGIHEDVSHSLHEAANTLEFESESCKFNCRNGLHVYQAGYAEGLAQSGTTYAEYSALSSAEISEGGSDETN